MDKNEAPTLLKCLISMVIALTIVAFPVWYTLASYFLNK